MGIKVNGNTPACLARTAAASILGIAAACIVLPSDALAQAWPAKPVRFILGFPPGGGSDILGRIVAAKMQEQMGQTVGIENRPGASGNIAAEQVAKSAPDGYTIGIGNLSTHTIAPSVYRKLPYDPVRDFAPISMVATAPNVMAATAALPVKNLKDVIACRRRVHCPSRPLAWVRCSTWRVRWSTPWLASTWSMSPTRASLRPTPR
jgi:tripartite-type tricarboxylate transporter receptor subunit TctC